MSGEDSERQRVEELERLNAELAAEIRSVTLGRASGPRPSLLGASRHLARVIDERDRTAAELEQQNASLIRLSDEIHELRRRVEVQTAEVERLRAGPVGLLRRAKASLLRRRG